MKTFVPLIMAVHAALAAPIDSSDFQSVKKTISDNTPLCGYVRIEETAWWSVGLQTHGTESGADVLSSGLKKIAEGKEMQCYTGVRN
ncbi:hypothetical protein GRF29_106g240401 [Pseudopithomyces chartarum]|uniref:Uncharacterized protein n=1 Tax=Pseudopithomyces chartarum TaxID=1892770 RepID=A0AAN6LSB4_9PLEO|nr:hypothetical protein GRF29_106g240401 [Pseudopithomyces chartarum]